MIMAGDADQSLYTVASPYARAGLDISGRTRILRTNFRNSRPINAVGEAFRARDSAHPPSAGERPWAFREGPLPELYEDADAEVLLSLLLRKLRLFLDELGYAAESLCILAPHRTEIARLQAMLSEAGLATAVVPDPDFSFEQEGAVRISTLHSAKGLDFPVVLLYLPYLHRPSQYDDAATERMLRNLLYVGVTRAMENLNVFMNPEADPLLGDLATSLRAVREEGLPTDGGA